MSHQIVCNLKEQVRHYIPEALLDFPGEVLMSGLDTLSETNRISIMGYNPGGVGLPPISEQLQGYVAAKEKQSSYSAYLDQCWHKGYWPDRACPACSAGVTPDRHQKGVKAIAEVVGFDLRQALAVNAIFCQTGTVKDFLASSSKLRMSGWEIFNEYFWPIHKWLLTEVTRTRLLICLGNASQDSAFSYVAKSLGITNEKIIPGGPTYRFGKYFLCAGMLVVGVPHPSRFGLADESRNMLKTVASPFLEAGTW